MAPEATWRSPSHHLLRAGSLVSIHSSMMGACVCQSLRSDLAGGDATLGSELNTAKVVAALEE